MPGGQWQPRRAGLSRKASVKSLLSNFNDKGRDSERQSKIQEPDDPTAPPISDSSSDDEAISRRGDIRPTGIGTKSNTDGGEKPTYGIRKSARTAPSKPQSPKRQRDSDDEIEEPVKKAKVTKRKDDSLGSQFETALQRKAVGSRTLYGAQKKGGYGKAAKIASKHGSNPDIFSSPDTPKSVFMDVDISDDFLTPEKPVKRFAVPDAKANSPTPSPAKAFKSPPSAPADLDTPSPSPKKQFKHPPDIDDIPESSPEKPRAKPANSKNNADGFMKKMRIIREQQKAEREAKQKRQQEMDDDSPKAVFKMPAGLTQDDLDPESDLDVLEDSIVEDLERLHDERMFDVPPVIDGPVCPMCGEAVAQELLDKFSKKKFMNITKEHLFCNYHKAKAARKTWVDRGYPDINWPKLDQRIAKHYDFIEDILNGGASYYGTVFGKSIRSGQNKTLLKTDQNVTPGYYGSRGARVMEEKIIDRFSALLKKVAVEDRLVSARGHTVFVQFVLVPELAVRLIMEDMDVSAEKAREVMDESRAVGDLLNEEEDDVIEEDGSDGASSSSLSSIEDGDISDGLS